MDGARACIYFLQHNLHHCICRSRCTDHEVFFPAGAARAHRVSVKYEIIGWAGRSLIRNGTPRACQLYCHFIMHSARTSLAPALFQRYIFRSLPNYSRRKPFSVRFVGESYSLVANVAFQQRWSVSPLNLWRSPIFCAFSRA
jgi:hypothetical protein